ncbi:phthiocerol/phthiodiolone dimycocerosyl transferase family protein [Nocardia salmonicida]|uniref:phthiocerol/phthiodiolone dimycocerosyl transferase family protein n=1 Tax=Nocardia salmonicida TaxID=53431 RepID=UPI0037B99C9A
MTSRRRISPFESSFFGTGTTIGSVPTGGMPLFLGTTVHGVLDPAILRTVLDELAAAHPLLRSRVVTDDGVGHFVRDDDFRPRFDIVEGGEAEYLALVNGPRNWSDGLFRAYLLRAGLRQQIVLVVHHGISDGRSGFALLGQMWRHYTAHATGIAVPEANSDQSLPEAMDTLLAEVVSVAAAEAWLDEIRAGAATMGPEDAPRTLPRDGSDTDPLGRFAMQRIELSAEETAGLVTVARAHGLSVTSVLAGTALTAFRTRFPESGSLPMFCGYAADVRAEFDPPVPAETVVNFASGAGVLVHATGKTTQLELAHSIETGLRAGLDRREPAHFPLAAQLVNDELTATLLSAPPTIAISNIGRLQPHSIPDDIAFVRDDVYAMGPAMPPKLTTFTIANRLTLQLEYDTALYRRTHMEKLRLTLVELLQTLE